MHYTLYTLYTCCLLCQLQLLKFIKLLTAGFHAQWSFASFKNESCVPAFPCFSGGIRKYVTLFLVIFLHLSGWKLCCSASKHALDHTGVHCLFSDWLV